MAALLGTLPIGVGACGLLIGLEDHQAFPGVDAGEDVDERPDAQPDAVDDAPPDVGPDGCSGAVCGDHCVDTSTDAKNCGACDAACAANVTCTAGVCGDHIDQISAGANHGCALLHDGSIWCWGNDGSGQLGIPPEKDTKCNTVPSCQPTPTRVEGLPPKMIQVSAGADFTCGIQVGGTVWCWGSNTTLQLGRATNMGAPDPAFDRTPLPIKGLPPMAQVSAAYGFACARAADGSKVYCWGSNETGTLGNGQLSSMQLGLPPSDVVSVPAGVIDISTGLIDHACALTSAHEVWCWGSNRYGQLGHATMTDPAKCPTYACNSTPAKVAGLVVTGDRIFATGIGNCVETSGGFVCWGGNPSGQLGTTPDFVEHPTPALVPLGGGTVSDSFDARYGTSFAFTANGFTSWGDDTYGELGRGMLTSLMCAVEAGGVCDPTPIAVKLTSAPKQLSAGAFWAMALTKENQIYAWGANLDGRIGHAPNTGVPQDYTDCGYGKMESCNPTPQLVPQPGAP